VTGVKSPLAAPPLGVARVVGYGVGDFAFNLTFTFCSLFLLYFYTDVLGLSATTGGLIIMAALIWEGVTDPIVGVIANKTRSRWGRYRPYLLLGALPLAASFAAMFVPLGLSGASLAIYAFATHLLFRTVYTVVNVPYIALSAQMTTDSLVRGRLAGTRMMFAILCGLVLAGATLPLVKAFGGGASGFFALCLLYGAAVVVILLVCFASTREAVQITERHPTLPEMMRAVRSNPPFLALLAATLMGSVAYTMSSKALLYYMKYQVGSEDAVTTGLAVGLLAAALSMPIWMAVTRRTSKRAVWLSGVVLTTIVALVIYGKTPGTGPLLWTLLAVSGAGNAAFILSFWSMVPDTVEYGQLRTGMRAEGAIFGFVIFSQKVALGLGTGLLGVILDVVGYRANQVQSGGTLHGILVMYTLVPMGLSLAAAACIWFYRLDQPTHARIVSLVARRSARSRVVMPQALGDVIV
jgi:GPH family glycoside/pentoside/hexuronide:cation symporter